MWVAVWAWVLLVVVVEAFRRDGVEAPPRPALLGYRFGFDYFGNSHLPLRDAVEKIPTVREREQEHFPLRDAVEKRIAPSTSLGSWWRKIPATKQSNRHGKRIFCFVESWASYRSPPASFSADDIDPFSCSHVIYAFATIDSSHSLVPFDKEYDIVKGGYRSVIGLKRKNSNLKILLSVTGKLSKMVSTASNRGKFIRSVGRTLAEHGFDGLDIHWERPGDLENGGRKEDKENLALLIEELSSIMNHKGWILTASVSPDRFTLPDAYDVPRIAPHLQYILLKSYDFNQDEAEYALHPAPLKITEVDSEPISVFLNVVYAVRFWLSKGALRNQLILGIPFFGRSYTLEDPENWLEGAPVIASGYEARYTQQPGFMAYYEVCSRIKSKKWVKHKDDGGSPFMVKEDQWVGYEDADSIKKKMDYLKKESLGGVMIWSLDLDDFKGICGEKYPLLNAVRTALNPPPTTAAPPLKPSPGAGMTTVTSQALCLGEGYAADAKSCSVYYRCSWALKTTYICPDGLFFDPNLNLCNLPQYVSCPFRQSITKDVRPNIIRDSFPDSNLNWNQNFQDIPDDDTIITKNAALDGPKVVCYFTNWALYRLGDGKFFPEQMNPTLCTHIVYAFASLDPNTLTMIPFDPWADIDYNLYERVAALKKKGPSVLLALGGWTDSTGDKYSRLVSSGSKRRAFISSALGLLRRYGFTGLSMEWNYPVCWQSNCKKGPASDKENYVKLLQELREAMDKETPRMELAVSVSGYKEILENGFDLAGVSRSVDFMSVMTYDYHGAWEGITGHVSPLYGNPKDKVPYYNTDSTIKYIIGKGAQKEKIIMGVPLYGQSFKLKSKRENGLRSPSDGLGEEGPYTQQPGMLSYYEICSKIKKNNWRKESSPDGPYAYGGDQWVSFEDKNSIMKKGQYVKSEGLGGMMAWTVDLDDYMNTCCEGQFPLLMAVNEALGRDFKSTVSGCEKPTVPDLPPPPTTTLDPESGLVEWTEGTTQASTTNTWWPQKPTTPTTTPTTEKPWWETSTTPTTTTRRTTTTTRRTTTTTTRTTTTRPTTTTRRTTTTDSSGEVIEAGPDAPDSCTTGDYKPVPGNCNAFYRCILGEYVKQNCAGGLHWNNRKKICDWPSDANCNSGIEDQMTTQRTTTTRRTTTRPTTEWWQTSTTTRPTTEWWQTTSEPSTWWPTTQQTTSTEWWTTTTRPPTIKPPMPPMEMACTNGQYYPVPNACDKFYICVNGVLVQQTCAPGLHWNPDSGICDWAFSVNCASGMRWMPTYITKDNGCDKGTFAPYPGSCNKYLQCLWEKYEVQSCAPGLHWNQRLQICDWPATAGCKKTVGPGSSEYPEEVNYPNPDIQNEIEPTTNRPVATKPPTTTTEWSWKPEEQTQWSWTSTTTEEPWPETPYVHPNSGYYKVVCYFTNWAWYRQGAGKYLPEDIDSDLCTHVVYGFAVLDFEKLVIKAHDSWADFDNNFYNRVTWFRRKGVKVSLALGGWNDSAGDKYSRLVNNPSARRRFIEHAVPFLLKYKFDGLDLDWEYPKCWQTSCDKGPDSDKENFGHFVRELRREFDKHDLLLSAAVSPSKKIIDEGYDLKAIADSLDWVAVMCYDYHGQWDKKTGHVAPMYEHPEDDFYYFNTNYTINYWIDGGVPRRKLVLGMPLYGQGFTLANPKEHGLNAPAPGPSTAGEFTRAAGFLAYYEICDRINRKGWTVVKDPEGRMGPYAYKENQWVGFDDVQMIKYKSEWIREMDLGGGMIWALDLDDFKNTCGQGKHPLLTTIAKTLESAPSGQAPTRPTQRPTRPRPEPTTRPTRPMPEETTRPTRPRPEVTTRPTRPRPEATRPTRPRPEATTRPPMPEEPEMPEENESPSMLPGPDGEYKVVCYFTNWAWYRQGTGKYLPSDIDPTLCTHVVYGFAVLDGSNKIIKPHDSWADIDNKFYEKVTALKKKGVKVTIAIGGWNDSAGDKYSRLVNDPGARARFISHVIKFILDNNFDGLDLDWEYPKCWQVDCKKGPDSDKQAFADFVTELREAFNPHGLLLSAAVSPAKSVVDAGYDVPTLSAKLDWIAVMCYDYHGQWDKKTGHVAPMYPHDDDFDTTFNANFTMHYWVKKGADPKKLIMGMPMYGQSFSLADNSNNGLNAPTYGGGEAGDGTRARGFLSYYEICDRIKNKGWKVVRDETGSMGPYALLRDQWVGFDDAPMIKHKSEYVKMNRFGGAMIWALDLDDFRNSCGCEEYPLLRTINRVLRNYPPGPVCSVSETNEIPDTVREKDIVNIKGEEGPCPEFAGSKKDCSKFYMCQFGKLIQQSCPPGLHFNSKNLMCDWPENAQCIEIESNEIDVTTETPVITVGEPEDEIITIPEEVDTVETPMDTGFKVVCYFTNWAWYRLGDGKYLPEDVETSLCTHIVYAFAVLDPNRLEIKSHDPWADVDNEFYTKMANLGAKGIKVLLGLGGWNDSEGDKYSRLVNSPSARRRFVKQAVQFVGRYGFQGLDLDWEYPKCWQVDCKKGPASDKEGFAALVTELSAAFKPKGWLLSAAVSPSKVVIDEGYNVPVMNQYLDWISLMAYDYHGHWDKKTGHVAPLYYTEGDEYSYFNTNFSVHYWLDAGTSRDKLVLGMPLYGQSFTLGDTEDTSLGAPSTGPGTAGQFTRAAGFLAFYEICETVSGENWKIVRNPEGTMGPYAYKNNQWVSYDDVEDIRKKAMLVKDLQLGGGMVWALDLDDFRNKCGCGKYPLLSTINQELRGRKGNTNNCT